MGDEVVVVLSIVVPSLPAGLIVDSAGEVVTVVVSVVVAGLAAVVLSAGDAAGAAVSVFCSHATSSAAPARMQMYFFIGCGWAMLG